MLGILDCKTAVLFANASEGPYSNERSGASEKRRGRIHAGRVRLARFTLEDHAYGASRLPKTSENDCFAVYRDFQASISQFLRTYFGFLYAVEAFANYHLKNFKKISLLEPVVYQAELA